MSYETRMPTAVRKAGEAADAELNELRRIQAEEQGSPPGNPDSPPTANPDNPPAPDAGIPGEGKDKPTGPIDYKVEFGLLSERFRKLEARFSVIQGKYNAEVPDLNTKLRAAEDKLAAKSGSTADSTQEFTPSSEREKELVDLYGPDFVKHVEAKAREIVGEQVNSLREEFGNPAGDPKAIATNLADNFFTKLNEAHPDWEALNMTHGWHEFLREIDEASGLQRQALIDQAQERGDPGPVIFQLTQFKKQGKSGKERMGNQTVPADTGGSPPIEHDEQIVKASEIREFYKRVTEGRYRGKEDEAAQLEAKYALAHKERRIDESA